MIYTGGMLGDLFVPDIDVFQCLVLFLPRAACTGRDLAMSGTVIDRRMAAYCALRFFNAIPGTFGHIFYAGSVMQTPDWQVDLLMLPQ